MRRIEELAAHVPRLTEGRVTCVGDIILDQFIYGAVERISPEAPIPVLRVTRESTMLGGLGNVARNLASLGAACHVHSVIGDDDAGQQIRGLLAELPHCRYSLVPESARKTTIKTRCIAAGQQLLRVDRESLANVGAVPARALVDEIQSALQESHILVLSDYGKGVLTPLITSQLIQAANDANRVVIVDPKGSDYTRYRGATLVTPNRHELSLATGMSVDDDDAIVAAARHLIETCQFHAVLATRSEQGMTLVSSAGDVKHLLSEAREVFDVSGAGDTVVATVAAGLAIGLSLHDAAQLANVAAGIAVGKVGTAAVRADELIHALRRQVAPNGEEKITTRSQIGELVERWRVAGLKVGFTNGCFDLLHPGHVSLLDQSSAKCDRLVVGLNSDASVQRLKGPERPVNNETYRATMLAALASVAAVVVFDEDTPQQLIERVRPDVLIKGADYKVENVVGASFVQHYGGEVVLINLVPQQSTTRLLEKIRSAPG